MDYKDLKFIISRLANCVQAVISFGKPEDLESEESLMLAAMAGIPGFKMIFDYVRIRTLYDKDSALLQVTSQRTGCVLMVANSDRPRDIAEVGKEL